MSTDAIVLLKNDHREIRKLFRDFHGAGPNLRHTYVLGRANEKVDGLGRYPIADFVAAGWAIYSMDYANRPPRKVLEEIDVEDFVLGIESLRRHDFIDKKRVALFGHSHGGNLVCRMAARIDAACGVPGALRASQCPCRRLRGVLRGFAHRRCATR